MDLPPVPERPAVTTRVSRPLTVSGIVGVPGGVGVDVSYQFNDRLALSGQASTWIAMTDVGAQARYFFVAYERSGFFVAGGLHALVAPALFPFAAPAISAEVGGEFRAQNGFTIGVGAGVMGVYAPPGSEGGGNSFGIAPLARLRFGFSF